MGCKDGEGNEDEVVAKGQETLPDESRADVSVHGLWKW